ncbi:glutathione S-transferase [Dongia mobilis]|uniref:Glutathione S-transferase n=1 Tax=Dongia mobilis TaxID=578943 RepID=A0A4R6WMW7_9PROT|nr:glutathione S-transferase family protein [Dongia mobilis]TDQ82243.1 glutathione S-transferase [Dongia mobilis]
MSRLTLILGNKNYSSWSLRGYLAAKASGLPFKEVVIPLRMGDTSSRILAHSPSGRVPALVDGDIVVWESLAICEYLAELAPEAGLWPKDRAARAHARAISAEMHAGFASLRRNLPMDITHDRHAESRAHLAKEDIDRVLAIWHDTRARFGEKAAHGTGPFLYGGFSAADAMYAPVATRFRTYGVRLDPQAAAYCEAILAWPAFKEWEAAALTETAVIEFDVFQKAD